MRRWLNDANRWTEAVLRSARMRPKLVLSRGCYRDPRRRHGPTSTLPIEGLQEEYPPSSSQSRRSSYSWMDPAIVMLRTDLPLCGMPASKARQPK
jgi:hypothetical protein